MAIHETYARLHEKRPDVLQYDHLPEAFRVQVVSILENATGAGRSHYAASYWSFIAKILANELGRFQLVDYGGAGGWEQCRNLLMESSPEETLSLIEMSFRQLHLYAKECPPKRRSQTPDAAVAELNERFKLHGIGYEFTVDRIIRIDSQYLHAESVKPALMLLKAQEFKGAETEFLQAHDHFRKGNYEDTLTWALKSLESAMKMICEARKIPYDPQKDTAKRLIEKMFDEKVIPSYMQSEFAGLRSVLEAGSPTLRNRSAGHGQGSTPRNIPSHFAAYALHMAASNIVFLVECHTS